MLRIDADTSGSNSSLENSVQQIKFFDVLTCARTAAMLGATKGSPRSHAGALVPTAHMRASGLRELTEGKMEKGGPGGATSDTGESLPPEELRQEAAMLSRGFVEGASSRVQVPAVWPLRCRAGLQKGFHGRGGADML